ncbi:MAG TPA: heme-binding domain-containing protein [Vicinamibacterales bacterium]|nr:heme-binding domain-containing protein [Vicinamibacterales bacterium]
MRRGLTFAVVVLAGAFVAAQLASSKPVNPPTDANRTIQTFVSAGSALPGVLDRSCRDCHSNQTTWPWYTKVVPLNWVMSSAVKEGRRVVNFSEWAGYPSEKQRVLLAASCQAATSGKMPGGAWTMLHSEAKLSAQDIETICAAAREAGAQAGVSR